jgi:hypothetical protein
MESDVITQYNTPGRLCFHAVHMTRSLTDSFGSQIKGNAIFFYLKPQKDFLASVDFEAVQTFLTGWNDSDIDCSQRTLNRLAKRFQRNIISLSSNAEGRLDHLDIIVFPALEDKPFIMKHSFRYISSENRGPPFHADYAQNILGKSHIQRKTFSNPNTSDHYCVCMRNTSEDGPPLNQSIIQATKGKASRHWYGNVFVRKTDLKGYITLNASVEDLKAVIDYFMA